MSEPIVLARHPRASRHVRLAKGWGGLVCFVLAVVLSHRAGVPTADALLRGLIAGVAGMLACWAATLVVWRQLALAEVETLRRRLAAAPAAEDKADA
ncbi:MAG TPA: hypothetical protein VD931_18620 [Baekduia sp.]|nr:hypothetical protein [Baekduia sp.]